MAKQKGIIKLEGTIGDITFLKTRDGHIAKEKSSIPANRIATDPAFQRTRENNAEFGHAGKTGKLIRNAFRAQIQKASDSKMVSRLTREMMRVIQLDSTNSRGQRSVLDGETEILAGFDFNVNGKLSTTLFAPYTASMNRVTGAVSIAIPPFVPADMVAAPAGSSHFRIFAAVSKISFEDFIFDSITQESGVLPWDNVPTAAINLAFSVTPNAVQPLFLVLGIEFMQRVNGIDYPLKNGGFNALAIVKVDGNY
jgi:hypothetical protein